MPIGIYDHKHMRGENNVAKRPEVRTKLRKSKSEETKVKMRNVEPYEHVISRCVFELSEI